MRPDEARRELWRRALLVLMLLAGIALAYLIFNVSRFNRLTDVNAMDYAQVARHVLRGEGFTTSFIKPLSLVYHRSIENHPDLTYPPLHIMWMAGVMRALGATDRAVAHSSGLAFLLTMPLVFWLALRIFDWRTAILATALCGTHITLLAYAISGLESSLLGLLVTALLLVLYTASTTERGEMPWVVVAGLLMGLIYLTKYIWLVAALPIAIYLALMKPAGRLVRVTVFLALIVVVASPWLYRNYRLTGNPIFTLRTWEMVGQTRAHPANTVYRTFSDHYQSYIVFVAENPRAIFEKVRRGLTMFYASFHGLAGIFVAPFFLVGILVRLGNEPTERLRLLVYALLILMSLALAFVIADPRLIAPLAPLMIVLATAFFWRLLDARLQGVDDRTRVRWITVAVAALLVLQMHPYVTEITPDTPTYSATETPLALAAAELAEMADGPIITDVPWVVAWMSDETAIWLPQTQIDFRRIEDAVGRLQWVFLTPEVARMAGPERLGEWASIWARGQQGDVEYLGFVISARLGDGRLILMKRRSEG